MRLDRYLVDIGRFDSRQKAQEAIKEGRVMLDGRVVRKPSLEIMDSRVGSSESRADILESKLIISGEEFVSRAGRKLQGFLQECERLGVAGVWESAIDVGAARGGFSQVLLRYGIKHICCVDVGSNQLHPTIAKDSRVEVFEQCDIRDFTRKYNRRFDLAVCDVSFIGIGCIVDDLCRLSDELIVLFKPQFEVGRGIKRSKRGVVQDSKAVDSSMQGVIAMLESRGFCVRSVAESSLKGKEGNVEFFIYACKLQ